MSTKTIFIYLFFIMVILINLTGCTKQESTQKTENKKNITNVSYENVENQSIAFRAEKEILSFQGILAVKAVNIGNDLYVAAKPAQYKRFQLDALKSDITKKLKVVFPSYKFYVSLDSKIYMLVENLQAKIIKKQIDTETIIKKGKKIQSEMNSDT